jgi:hypothetical protein
MTRRFRLLGLLALLGAGLLTGCGGHSDQPTAQERDLGPASTGILGGSADTRYLHVFSASISAPRAVAPRFSATVLYVGPGNDQLVRITTPLGDATLTQPLSDDSAVPIDVPLHGPRTGPSTPGSTVSVSVQLANHGPVGFAVPLVGPAPTPTATATS